MKKFGIFCTGLVVALASTTVKAQVVDTNAADGADGLSIWYDSRNVPGPTFPAPAAPYTLGTSLQSVKAAKVLAHNVQAGNAGGPGDGQTLYISPRLPQNTLALFTPFGLHWTGKKVGQIADQSNKTLYKYITVENRGATNEVIAALGLDIDITKNGTAGLGNELQNVVVNANGALWNGTNPSTVSDTGDGFSAITKAVKVPVSDNAGTPVYNATGGATSTVGSARIYNVGNLAITAGVWEKPATSITNTIDNSTYTVKDKVNNLLVTRVVQSGTVTGQPQEDPDFGYNTVLISGTIGTAGAVLRTGSNGGIPEANNGVAGNNIGDGLTIGTSSANADATIVAQPKGDFTNDNLVTGADNTYYNAAATKTGEFAPGLGALRQRELWLGDFNNDGLVTGGDNVLYNAYVTRLAVADCNVPANCP